MARDIIDIGVTGNDGTGDSIRESFRKVNDNFRELYAFVGQGDTIAFTDLDDTPSTLGAERIPISNGTGTALVMKTLEGGVGISVSNDDPNKIVINSTSSTLSNDAAPRLGGALNAANLPIGKVPNPSAAGVLQFNLIHGPAGFTTTIDELAINKGYADNRYVNVDGDTMTGALNVPAGATGTEVPRVEEVVTIGGSLSNRTMTSPLFLSDHPGALSGQGIPNGEDDLQAATKYYVDNSSFTSDVNLFVSTSGDDTQRLTPAGKEGGAFAYSYATVGAACRAAEEYINNAFLEPGPYTQKIAYTVGGISTNTTVDSVTLQSGAGASYTQAYEVLLANKKFIQEDTVSYVNITFPSFSYNEALCRRDVGLIIDAIALDIKQGGNYQSVFAGNSYYRNASARIASGQQSTETLAAIARAQLLAQNVLSNTNPTQVFQNYISRTATAYTIPTAVKNTVNDRFDTILDIVENGTDAAPTIDYGSSTYKVSFSNGGLGNVDQGAVSNTDIISGKLVRGAQSGAVARIVSYTRNDSPNFDAINCILLKPIEFVEDEELDYDSGVKEQNITIRIESGIYYEDLPIRVPPNVSIKGDEFRRVLIRPNDRTSVSPWVNLNFYRDLEFDELPLLPTSNPDAYELITANIDYLRAEGIAYIAQQVGIGSGIWSGFTYNQSKCSRDIGIIVQGVADDIKYGGNSNSHLNAGRYWDGATSKVVGQQAQTAAVIDQIKLIIKNYILINSSYSSLQTRISQVTTVSNGETGTVAKVETLMNFISDVIVNGLGQLPTVEDPRYGYHYLQDPSTAMNIGPNYTNAGQFNNAAELLTLNREYIQAEVAGYMSNVYSGVWSGLSADDRAIFTRDIGLILDNVVTDLRVSGRANAIDAGSRYYSGVITEAAVNYISTIGQRIIQNLPPVTTYQGAVTRISNIALPLESGATTAIANLISTVAYAFDPSYNPPKNNKDIDLFLMNDATILRNISGQGHGGFMMVLDPEGQILSKSPYAQTCSSFSASVNKQAFRGGQYIDGFSGRLRADISGSGTTVTLTGLNYRAPNTPTSFFSGGARYQINSITSYNPATGTAVVELDSNTSYSSGTQSIIIETAGYRSMLANDYTQVNDLGYGIIANNNGYTEQVSTFTYYNWTSYYASNGGQIRALNGSSANGQYGLRAVGSDPNELSDVITLSHNMLQVAKIYQLGSLLGASRFEDLSVYITDYQYLPFNISELEIDHGSIGITRYEVTNIEGTSITTDTSTPVSITGATQANPVVVTASGHGLTDKDYITITGVTGMTTINGSWYVNVLNASTFELYRDFDLEVSVNGTAFTAYSSGGTVSGGKRVLKLNFSTTGNNDTSSTGLADDCLHEQNVIIRSLQNLKFENVDNVNPVRPSTALTFDEALDSPYRTLAYGLNDPLGTALAVNSAILTQDQSYDYVRLAVEPLLLSTVDPDDGAQTMGATIGDTKVAVQSVGNDDLDRVASGELLFGWDGKLFRITEYNSTATPKYIVIEDVLDINDPPTATGISTPLQPSDYSIRAGVPAGHGAAITTKISTCRATGHDFLDIGTGSYNSTNYPTQIYGEPASSPDQENEVVEEGVGRVFWVSTDQNGIFRVGRFFTVDQGTGTVTFAASIALSNLDGIGFKRGVVVSEFSTDATMTDNQTDTVPTESAVRGYIDRRLGLEHGNNPISVDGALTIGPGFMDRDGLLGYRGGSGPTKTPMNLGGARLTNLAGPSANDDATTKAYVDAGLAAQDELSELEDVLITDPLAADLLVFTAEGPGFEWQNATVTGDIGLEFDSGANTVVASISSNSIVNADVNSSAAIAQSKLEMNAATTRANATGIAQADLGVAAFKSTEFTTTNGFVEYQSSSDASTGLTLGKIQYIASKAILGNLGGSAAAPSEVSSQNIVKQGFAEAFSTAGVLRATSVGTPGDVSTYTFASTPVTTAGGSSSIVATDSNGAIDAQEYKIGTFKIVDLNSTSVEYYTPGGVKYLEAIGNVSASVTLTGDFSLSGGSTLEATFADLAEYYEADIEYDVGTVLIFGGDKEVTTTTLFGDTRVAGVVSNSAAYLMNNECPGIKTAIALQGRVPVKVIGMVKKGDLLTTAAIAGYACKPMDPKLGTIIGKALEDKTTSEPGVIEVAVGRL